MTQYISVRNMLGADASCAKFPDAVMTMSFFFDNVIGLSRASARFAAALVRAGILTALHCLASKQLEHSSEAAKHVAGADAGDPVAEIEDVVMSCCAAFGRAVPRVSRRDCYCWAFSLWLPVCAFPALTQNMMCPSMTHPAPGVDGVLTLLLQA